ncbi:MAG TPA: ParB/RepB/Spo0J family partition protein [Myxococcaceae bacterium]|nr:ParB/RepB/Spo0J family partition protein [Myxococcaceae bacterium]
MTDTTIVDARQEFHEDFDLTALFPDPENHRVGGLGDLAELAGSIGEVGIQQPILATPHSKAPPGMLLIIAGHRRQAASLQAGRTTGPVIVRHGLSDDEIERIRGVENLQRADLTPIEEALIYEQRARKGFTDVEVAAFYGKSQGHVTRRRALLKLPEKVQAAVNAGGREGGISNTDAYKLSQLAAHPGEITRIVEAFARGQLGVSIDQAVDDAKAELGIVSRSAGRPPRKAAAEAARPSSPPASPAPAQEDGQEPVEPVPAASAAQAATAAPRRRQQPPETTVLRVPMGRALYDEVVRRRFWGGRYGFSATAGRNLEEHVRQEFAADGAEGEPATEE